MYVKRFLFFLPLLLSIVLNTGCASSTPTLVSPPEHPQVTSTSIPTVRPIPTETLRPSLTPKASTATATQLPVLTLPPTPDPALSKVKFIGLSWFNNYDMLLSFQFPGPVDPKDYRVTLEDKEYKCEVLTRYPNRLYCRGQGAKVLAKANVRVFQVGSDVPGFEWGVWVPYFPK
jgi:hypothetical protein